MTSNEWNASRLGVSVVHLPDDPGTVTLSQTLPAQRRLPRRQGVLMCARLIPLLGRFMAVLCAVRARVVTWRACDSEFVLRSAVSRDDCRRCAVECAETPRVCNTRNTQPRQPKPFLCEITHYKLWEAKTTTYLAGGLTLY